MSDTIIPAEGEHLRDGWEPDTPVEDTLKRRAVLLHASWPVTIARGLGRPWRQTDRWAGATISERGLLSNPVVLLRPPGDDIGELLGEVEEVVAPPASYFLLSAWPTPDLRPHGLTLLGHPPLMVRLPGPGRADLPAGVEVREVGDAADLAVAEKVLVEGYPMPELQPLTTGALLDPSILDGRTQVWLGLLDGTPASVAVSHRAAGAVLVEYVAALASARGRGAGAAVTWAATCADPDLPAMLVASDDGRPVYESMGYLAMERWTAWLRP